MLRHNQQAIEARTATDVRLIHLALLACILVGATLLRVHALGKTSYWYDEICSVLYARGETGAIFAPPEGYFEHAPALASDPGMRGWHDVWFGFDTTPPLYPTVLRLWWHLFGTGDIAGRGLSVLLSVLTIVAIFDLSRFIMKPAPALWACALCAVSPPIVRYAQESRSYALLCLLGVLICDVTVRISRNGGGLWRYLMIGLLCAAAILTHNFAAGGIAAVALFAILNLRGRARLAVVGAIAIAVVLGLWELHVVVQHAQSARHGIDWTAEPRDGLLGNTIFRIAWLPLVYLILPLNDAGWVSLPALAIFILPIVLQKKRPGLLLMALWPMGIIGLVAASDLWFVHGSLLYPRYTLAAAPMVFVSLAALADLSGKWIRHALPALTVVGALLGVGDGSYKAEEAIKPETRELARDIREHVQPGDVLVIASRPTMGLRSASTQYLGIDFYAGPLPYSAAILEGPIDQKTHDSIWSHRRIWLVECWDGFSRAGQDDPASYLGPCRLTPAGDVHLFAGRLYLVEAGKQ